MKSSQPPLLYEWPYDLAKYSKVVPGAEIARLVHTWNQLVISELEKMRAEVLFWQCPLFHKPQDPKQLWTLTFTDYVWFMKNLLVGGRLTLNLFYPAPKKGPFRFDFDAAKLLKMLIDQHCLEQDRKRHWVLEMKKPKHSRSSKKHFHYERVNPNT